VNKPTGSWDEHALPCSDRTSELHTVPESAGCWGTFCSAWNGAITRHPVGAVVFFSGACTLTWAIIFGALCMSGPLRTALAAPEYAVGWLVMKGTTRLRVPLSAAIAAPLSAFVPALSALKIYPLLALFAADKETRDKVNFAINRMQNSPKLSANAQIRVQRFFKGFGSFCQFVERPVDKYGLSYYLVSKTVAVTTLFGATAAASYGIDVPLALSAIGMSGELQSNAGLLACAAAVNTCGCPLHFIAAVRAIQLFEQQATAAWRKKEFEHRKRKIATATSEPVREDAEEDGSKERHVTEAEMQKNLIKQMTLITLLLYTGFIFWVMRWLARSQKAPTGDGNDDAALQVANHSNAV